MNLRQALREGPPLIGTFLMLPRIEIVEMLSIAGFDAVIIDLEHGPHVPSAISELAAAAQGAGMFAIVRLGGNSEELIANVLDAGVDGILVPHVSSEIEAEKIARASRFPPIGDRSLNPYVRGTSYGRNGERARDDANGRVGVMVMIESQDGLTNIEKICAVASRSFCCSRCAGPT
jgi:4-hydroxy-2-oxoheptanedioate aldolase